MNDTPPEIADVVWQKLMACSAEERLVMGARMFEAGWEMILASFPPGFSPKELKRRLYGPSMAGPRHCEPHAPLRHHRQPGVCLEHHVDLKQSILWKANAP
ncbi:MAG: hypothetical protein ACK45B_04625 [Limisphaerales bacterium]